jgi:hypothetical protein
MRDQLDLIENALVRPPAWWNLTNHQCLAAEKLIAWLTSAVRKAVRQAASSRTKTHLRSLRARVTQPTPEDLAACCGAEQCGIAFDPTSR